MIRTAHVLALAALVSASSCGKDCPPCATGSGPTAAAGTAVTSPAIDSLLAGVPGNTVAIAFLDLATPPWQYLSNGLTDAERTALDKELRDYVTKFAGIDISKIQYAVAFVGGPPPTGAILIKTVGGTPTLPGATDVEGAKLWVIDPGDRISIAMKGDTVILGEDGAVRAALETLAQKRKSVVAENKALVDFLHKETTGAVIGLAGIVPKDIPLPPQVAGLQKVAASLSSTRVRAVIEGDDATIGMLQGMADGAIAQMLNEAQRAHDDALAGNMLPPEGFAAILGAAHAKSWAAKLKPKREGNKLSAQLDIPNLGGDVMTLAVGGILAAVAVPAFMDYTKKSKVPDAMLHLNRIGKNLKVSWITDSVFPKGDAPLTPADPCCSGPDHKCPVVAWDNPVWQALDFQIDEPSLFQYRYQSDGNTAYAEAIGDLDCDGIAITYKLAVDAPGGNPRAMITEPPPNSD